MEPYDSKFHREPIGFAKANVLQAADPELGPYKDKVQDGEHAVHLLQVAGVHRVAFAEIVPTKGTKGSLSFVVTARQETANQFPIFWLPYQAGQTTRCTLKISKSQPTQGLGQEVVQPDIFLTVGLTGCTISVSGDPRSPTVYHSAQATVKPVGENQIEDTEQNRNILTEQFIDGIVQRGEQAFPKYPSQQVQLTHLFPRQYGPSIVNTEILNQRDSQIRREHSLIKGKIGITDGATVLGVRDWAATHSWRFYCQEWSNVTFERYFRSDYDEWIVRRVYPFWPGQDQVHPNAVHVPAHNET